MIALNSAVETIFNSMTREQIDNGVAAASAILDVEEVVADATPESPTEESEQAEVDEEEIEGDDEGQEEEIAPVAVKKNKRRNRNK